MSNDIRWKQRFQNFQKAVSELKDFLNVPHLNKFEKQGLIQCFEYTFELGWKCLKDYLEYQGYQVKSPRDSIKLSFQIGIVENGHLWMDALEKRNLLSHSYNEEVVTEAEHLIRTQYFSLFLTLREKLESEV
jgi:nucleotidyltransferase substrate binding protein (TIGR01987 family)